MEAGLLQPSECYLVTKITSYLCICWWEARRTEKYVCLLYGATTSTGSKSFTIKSSCSCLLFVSCTIRWHSLHTGAAFLRICAYKENAENVKRIAIAILMLNWWQFSDKHVICITFLDKSGKFSTPLIFVRFTILMNMNWNETADMRKRGQRKRV